MRQGIRTSVRYRVLKRDGFKCSYCGVSASESPLEIDHIQPVSLGGTNHMSNLCAACRDCNSGKSNNWDEWLPCSPTNAWESDAENAPLIINPVEFMDIWNPGWSIEVFGPDGLGAQRCKS